MYSAVIMSSLCAKEEEAIGGAADAEVQYEDLLQLSCMHTYKVTPLARAHF